MDGEARMEVTKSVGFCCEFVKKQKPFPCFYQGDGFQIGLKTCSVLPKLQSIRLRLMSLRRLLCYALNFSTKLHSAKCSVAFLNFIKMKNCSFIRT